MTHFSTLIKITRFASVLLLSISLAIPTVVGAQSRAQKSIITQLLWQSLLQCYEEPTERIGAEDEVVLRVELNTQGDISNLPDLISPASLSKGERGLLREATLAIINCTPITSGGGEKSIYGRFDMVLNRDGVVLTNVDAFVGKTDVLPTLDALDVANPEPALVETTVPGAAEETEAEVPVVVASGEPATLAIENELGLSKTERLEIQRRLVLMDYNTRGVDGVFGNGTP